MSEFISAPTAFWILMTAVVIVGGVLIFYALRTKGDVFAKLSHGLTSFELQAKERPRPKSLK